MSAPRTTLLTVLAAAALAACDPAGDQSAEQGLANPLLAYVPTDTPYVFANIEPTPAAITDAYLVRMAPMIEAMENMLDDIRIEINASPSTDDEQAIDLFMAVYQELAGNLNRDGIEAMGLSLESHHAIYGNGLFPVFRLGLGDTAAFRATVDRIESRAGVEAQELRFRDAAYWRLGGEEAAVFIAIVDDHVAVSLFPLQTAETDFLPGFLGLEMPAASVASEGTLAALNRERGYSAHGSGYIDFQAIADQLLDPDSLTTRQLSHMTGYDARNLGPVCTAEIREIITHAPRATAGVTELNADTIGMRYQLDVETGLAGQLADLVADVPKAVRDAGRAFSLSLGIEVGRLRELALEKVNEAVAEPFQCPQLADLNAQFEQMAEQLNQPMPPFIGNLKGFRVAVSEIDLHNFQPESAKGLFSLEVENPQILGGLASSFLPGMEGLELEPGGDPVELPQELMTMATPDLAMQAVMSRDAIGIAIGREEFERLLPFMEDDSDNGDVFLSVDYDMAAFMDMPLTATRHANGEDESWQDHQADMMTAYRNMVGRSRIEVSFTADGLVVDSQMSFR